MSPSPLPRSAALRRPASAPASRSRRGQGASEYLVLLAVVLIVAMVAMVLLGTFSGFGGDARVTESHQYWSSNPRPFTVQEFSQQGTTLYLTLQNMESDRYVLTNVSAGDTTLSVSSTYSGGNVVYNGGSRKLITLNMSKACDSKYDTFEYSVNISYNSPNIQGGRFYGAKSLVGACVP